MNDLDKDKSIDSAEDPNSTTEASPTPIPEQTQNTPDAQKAPVVAAINNPPMVDLLGNSSPNQQSNEVPPLKPSKPKKKLFIIIAILVVVLLLLSFAITMFIVTANTTSKKEQPQNSQAKSFSSFENSYQGKTVAFALPADPQGWRVVKLGVDGVNSYASTTNKCNAVFTQNRGVGAAISKGSTLDSQTNSAIESTANSLKNNDLKTSSSSSRAYKTSDGKEIEFLTKQATYTGNDGVAYTQELQAQWAGDYEFFVLTACPTSEWNNSKNTIDQLLDKVTLTII
ncbi:MAG: hypothetical protein WCP56_01755 [Candidatus Saccharibacteria bacterium]